MKKCFSFLLTLLVLLAMPVSAFAADDVFTRRKRPITRTWGCKALR